MKIQDLQINQFMLKNLSMGFCDRILCVWCAPILAGSILVAFIIFSFNPAFAAGPFLTIIDIKSPSLDDRDIMLGRDLDKNTELVG